jgi:hypothetical protein
MDCLIDIFIVPVLTVMLILAEIGRTLTRFSVAN